MMLYPHDGVVGGRAVGGLKNVMVNMAAANFACQTRRPTMKLARRFAVVLAL
jgi:hypothetical protein